MSTVAFACLIAVNCLDICPCRGNQKEKNNTDPFPWQSLLGKSTALEALCFRNGNAVQVPVMYYRLQSIGPDPGLMQALTV